MLFPKTDLILVARVLKANGTDGETVLGLRGVDLEELNPEEPVFIMFDGSPVPFFIESMKPRGLGKALVRLTGIRSVADVEELAGADVYVEASSLSSDSTEDDDLSFLVGWALYDVNSSDSDSVSVSSLSDSVATRAADSSEKSSEKSSGDLSTDLPHGVKIGEITAFDDIPCNPCIEVETKKGAVMVPLHEDLIVSLDPESRVIVMAVPSGLL